MDNNTNMGQKVITFVIVAAIAATGGYALASGKQDKPQKGQEKVMSNTSMEGSDHNANLQSSLTRLFTEHVDLALNATRSGFDGSSDFKAVAGQLDQNSVAIAGAIESVYGKEAGNIFLTEWRNHIGFFVDYTVATKSNDSAGQEKAVQGLMNYIQNSADFLSSANPNLEKEDLVKGFTMHITQLKNSVDAYAQGDYAKAYALQAEATVHMQGTATLLADAIVAQFPDKF